MVIQINIFLSNKGGNKEISGFYGIFQIFPEDLPKPCSSQRQRKFELFNPSQAKREEQV